MDRPRPNIVFVMADDHAAHAMSCYGSRLNTTPHIDRIATAGMRFDNCFCTNSICSPSRASILTGTYSHVNGVTGLDTPFDARQTTFPQILREHGYQTALIGKWHLGLGGVHDPTGFDHWDVLPGQGDYVDPELIRMGEARTVEGYATDIITDLSLRWLEQLDTSRPFLLMCHHKAPHRPWQPDPAHAQLYADVAIPVPATFDDDYSHRASAASSARMRVARDLGPNDLKAPVPDGLSPVEEKHWKYQRYIKDYLRCVASIDDNVGRLLDWLEVRGLSDDTVVVYTSDQGFFLGDHGWYDKRFMYEESLRMPFVISYPALVPAGTHSDAMLLNVDFAPTFLELAGIEPPDPMQGASAVRVLRGQTARGWRTSMYYRYWMHLDPTHHVQAHRGIRTHRYKLIRYDGEHGRPEWELFDLETDPFELHSVYDDPAYASTVTELERELRRLQDEVGDRT